MHRDRPFDRTPTAYLYERIARYRAAVPLSSDPKWVASVHDTINEMLTELQHRGELQEPSPRHPTTTEG